MSATSPITIVVPVYSGAGDVRRCLDSVRAHAPSMAVDLLVIDDASPEPEVRALVDELPPNDGPLTIRTLRNEQNLGFVATVNRGMAEAKGDVVVLNADTVVTAGWLERLTDAARSEPGVATVTPLTNFGSICTLPASVIERFALDGEEPLIDECAAFVAEHSLGLRPEVITGVGFCLYITREAIDVCGELDVETFGRGYGEEVDFCLRATRLGFRHLVDDSTFVYHKGGVSFGEARARGLAQGSSLLHDRYPFFRPTNRRERQHDPLAVPFAALELALAPRDERRPHVLQILHSNPGALGGTEKHLDALLTALLPEFDFSTFFPVESGFVLRTMWRVEGHDEPVHHEFLLPGAGRRVRPVDDEVAGAALQMALDLFPFDAVHIQNLVGHSLSVLRTLADFDGPVVCSVRDLYLACPHHWLLYLNVAGCGIPADLSYCEQCLPATTGLTLEHQQAFRSRVHDRKDVVDHWVFASQSAADYLRRVYDLDDERVHLIEHGAIITAPPPPRPVDEALVLHEPLRLAFVGIGWPKKGLHLVNQLADWTASTSIEVHHFGRLRAEASPALICHGPYDNDLLPDLLDLAGIQVVLLPGPYAETFGHVMTEALVASRPVIAAGYGALAERIRRHGAGWTIDPDNIEDLITLVQHLDRCRTEVLRASRAAAAVDLPSVEATAPRYASLYRPAGELDERD